MLTLFSPLVVAQKANAGMQMSDVCEVCKNATWGPEYDACVSAATKFCTNNEKDSWCQKTEAYASGFCKDNANCFAQNVTRMAKEECQSNKKKQLILFGVLGVVAIGAVYMMVRK